MSRPSAALRRPEYVGDPLRDAWRRLTRLGDRLAPRVRRWAASPWFLLGAGGAAISAVTLVYVSWLGTFFVMSDEMTYMKEAVHVWDHGGPLPSSDIFYASVSQLPALLRAPTLVLGNVPAAWDAMHVVNVVAFVSAAIPAYLVAREIVDSRRLAVVAALTCVFVPWIAITGSLLTEGIAYPAFLWAIAAMYFGLTRPSWRTDVIALGGIGLAAGARSQQIALLPAYVAAIVAHTGGWALHNRAGWRKTALDAARRHALVLGSIVALALVAAVGGVARFQSLLGNYSVAAHGDLFPHGTLQVAREVTSLVAIAVGGLPLTLAIAFVLATFWRPDSRERHAFAALTACSALTVVAVASSFIIRFSAGAGLAERYASYIAPLLLLSAFAALSVMRRTPIALVAASAVAWWLFTSVPRLIESNNAFAPAAPLHKILNADLGPIGARLPWHWQPVEVAGALVVVATLALALPRRLIAPRRLGGVVAGLLAAAVAGQTLYALHTIGWPQHGSSPAYLATRDWVDKSVGWKTKVAAVLGEAYDPVTSSEVWWEAQFWNRAVDQEYLPPGNDPMNQDRFRPVSVDPRTGALRGLQDERYTLSSSSNQRFRIAGARLVRNVGLLTLERIPARPRAVWSLDGTDSVGRLPVGSSAVYRRFRPGAPSVLYVGWAPQAGAARRPRVEVRARGWARTLSVPRSGEPVSVALPRHARVVRMRNASGKGTALKLTLVGDPRS